MNNVNKTLYIPLYGKSYVSKKNIILKDKKAEYIWEKEKFELRGKSKSKYLAYYMGIRSYVFDQWLKSNIDNDTIVLHIGCGMDSRCERVVINNDWYDIDFYSVIEERKKYFNEKECYHMIKADIREKGWLNDIPKGNVVVIMEGVSMYLTLSEIKEFLISLNNRFDNVKIMMDCYSGMGAKATKYKNPIKDVGVTQVYGIDDPKDLEVLDIKFEKEHNLIPKEKIEELKRLEKFIFKHLYAGSISKKLYRLYEYRKQS